MISDLCDVTALRKPLTTAATIAEEATLALDGRSGLLGKDSDARGTWHDLIERVEVGADGGDDLSDIDEMEGAAQAKSKPDEDDDLASFKL